MKNLFLVVVASLLSGCAYFTPSHEGRMVTVIGDHTGVKTSKKKQIENSIVNDYATYQALNYSQLKKASVTEKLHELDQQVNEVVMELLSELKPEVFEKPIIIRPIEAINDSTRQGSLQLVEESFETNFKSFGFQVFDDRKPKGKLDGDELIFTGELLAIGNNYYLSSTIKSLNSNKSLASKRSQVIDYFFKNIQDGVEVFEPSDEY